MSGPAKSALAGLALGGLIRIGGIRDLDASGNPHNDYNQYRLPWPEGVDP